MVLAKITCKNMNITQCEGCGSISWIRVCGVFSVCLLYQDVRPGVIINVDKG
jgi:hypothetical protein